MNKTMIQMDKPLMYITATKAQSQDVILYMLSQDKLAVIEPLLSRIINFSVWNLPQLLL